MPLHLWINYWLNMTVFHIRRRIKLYADDRSRIFTRAALSILALIRHRNVSVDIKVRLFLGYARRFPMAISRRRMVQAMMATPDAAQIEQGVSQWLSLHPSEGIAIGFYEALRVELLRAIKSGVTQAALCKFSRDNPEQGFVAMPLCGELNGHIVVVAVPGASLNNGLLHLMDQASKITLIGPLEAELESFKSIIFERRSEGVTVELCIPAKTYLAPYSQANQHASQISHQTADKIIAALSQTPSIYRRIKNGLDKELALAMSDRLYRFFQLVSGFNLAVGDQSAAAPVIILPSPALSYGAIRDSLAGQATRDIYAWDFGGAGSDDEALAAKPQSINRMRGLLGSIRTIHTAMRGALVPIFKDGEINNHPQIIVAASHGNIKYRGPVASICETLSSAGTVTPIETFAPAGKVAISKTGARPNLHTALTPKRAPYWMSYRRDLSHMLSTILEQDYLGDVPLHTLRGALADILIGRIDALIALACASRIADRLTRGRERPLLFVLVPGRDPALRAMARAIMNNGFTVLDVQILFVSDLGRYMPPVTPHCTVIDSHARDHYISRFNMCPQTLHMIGTIALDEDIRLGKALGREPARQLLFGRAIGNAPVLLFAAQPLPEADLQQSICALGAYMKSHPNVHILVKLHPSHDEGLKARLAILLGDIIGSEQALQRAVFARERYPFHYYLPASDVMLTYYSNVGLLAPAFNMPLLSLPCSVELPRSNLVSIGLATPVTSLNDLPCALDKALALPRETITPRYIEENPHMESPSAGPRLAIIAKSCL